MKKPRLVYVEWLDSAGTTDRWIADDETLNPVKCVTVGFLKERTKKKLIICSSVHAGHWGWPAVIPARAVTKFRRMK